MASIDEANAKLDDDQEGRWTVSMKKEYVVTMLSTVLRD